MAVPWCLGRDPDLFCRTPKQCLWSDLANSVWNRPDSGLRPGAARSVQRGSAHGRTGKAAAEKVARVRSSPLLLARAFRVLVPLVFTTRRSIVAEWDTSGTVSLDSVQLHRWRVRAASGSVHDTRSTLFRIFFHTFRFGAWPRAAEQLSVVGVVFWTVALLLNRLRVGDGSGFDDKARVAADGVVWLLVALVTAGIAVPSRTLYAVSIPVYEAGSLLAGIVLSSFLIWRTAEE